MLALILVALPRTLTAQAPEVAPVDDTFSFYQDTTYLGYGEPLRQAVNLNTAWLVADGVTVTIKDRSFTVNNSNHGGAFAIATNVTFTIAPLNKTGRVVFENNLNAGPGGVFNPGNGSLWDITNASFINNKSTTSTEGGGAMKGNSTAEIRLTNVLFDGNSGRSGGALTYYGNARIIGSTFLNNIAHSANTAGNFVNASANGTGGAIQAKGAKLSIIRESSFLGNRALWAGGAIAAHGNESLELWDITDLSNNYAGFGGAIADSNNSNATNVDGIVFKYSGTSGITDYVYSGNVAKGEYMRTAADIAALKSGSIPFTPSASGGGFYYTGTISANNSNPRLAFQLADGVTVSIGKADNPSPWDSIATMDRVGTIGPGSTAKFEVSGSGGRLILHADNSYYQGSVSVFNGASLIVGNQRASLGGAITVAGGATFGGSGTLVTHLQSGSTYANRSSLTLSNDAHLVLGTEAATNAETLYINGKVTVGDGVVFNHDLFDSGSASRLWAENIILTGSDATRTINLGLLATGTFTLMEWSGTGIDATDFERISLTVSGVTNSPRTDATLSIEGNSLVASLTTINNLVMKWTGANGSIWGTSGAGRQKNWLDMGGSEEATFFSADTVLFDGAVDAANPNNRTIMLAPEGVIVSDMEVSGNERYEFQGAGGIKADPNAAGNAAFARSAKLKKSGSGELVFANTGANLFQGGIEIVGGMITFNRAAQLESGTGGIVFSDSGTLHAVSTVSGALSEHLTIAAGKTAEIKIDAGNLIYSGTLSGGTESVLRKAGAGTMEITSDNAASSPAVAVDAGKLILTNSAAALGGNITVNSGATFGGAGSAGNGGNVTIASGGMMEVGVNNAQSGTLTVYNLRTTGGAIFKFDLFKDADGTYKRSDRVNEAGASSITGTNIIDITSFATGTFNLGNIATLADSGRVTINDMELAAGGRISGTLSDNGGALELVMTSDQSRMMKWTGNGNATWNLVNTNWTDNGLANQYSYGDGIIFDDSASAASRNITIGGDEVRIADMTVSGNADYTFTGGGINASTGNMQDDGAGGYLFSGSGKLAKIGDGTLTFANDTNTFIGGVDINGGVVAISSGEQLGTSNATGINFTGNATLRATADLVLNDEFAIASGETGIVNTNGHDIAFSGELSGGVDTIFVKDGAGTMLMDASLSGFTGTLSIQHGVLLAGAEELFSTGKPAAIIVNESATLNLGGYDQTISNLTGLGWIDLSEATLTYTVASGANVDFAGKLIGSGTVIKQGAGKLTLSGSSNMAGGFVLGNGEIGLANSGALGSGVMVLAATTGTISMETGSLDISNEIQVDASKTLTLDSNGHNAEFSGNIGGAGTVAIEGTGTLLLSGNNSLSRLEINSPITIARSPGIAVDVYIANGSTLEYRDIALGQVSTNIHGSRVLFTNSTLSLTGQSDVENFVVGANARITTISVGALGGTTGDVTVRDGGWLKITAPSTLARNVSVDGGILVFGSNYNMSSLKLTGAMDFLRGGEIRLGGALYTGIYIAATADGGVMNMPLYDPHQGDMFMVVDIVDGNKLQITAYNKALEPGKDIVAGLDAMRASTNAVFSHIHDDFVVPLAENQEHIRQRSLWLRMVGTFAEHESDATYLGYKDNSRVGVVGFDWQSAKNYMLGGCIAYANTKLETNNGAITEMDAPVFGFYGAAKKGNFYTAANLSFALGNANTGRVEEHHNTVTGSYDFDSIGGGIEAGCAWPVFSKARLRPSIGLQYTNISFRDYEETGKGAVRLDGFNANSLQGQVNLNLSQVFKMQSGRPGMVDVGIGWRKALINDTVNAKATLVDYPDASLQIRGDKYDSDSVTARLGIRLMVSKTALFSVSYEYEYIPFGNHKNATRRDTFMASIRQSW
jgi:autotransporter-associated beta strand protein